MQPPGTTFLYVLDGLSAGGDTLSCNMVAAYNRLSPAFQETLHGLQAIHSGMLQRLYPHSPLHWRSQTLPAQEQAQLNTTGGGLVGRDPVISIRPVVRMLPATGEKARYNNSQCESRQR